MIDTHTHLYMSDYNLEDQPDGCFDGQIAAVERARKAGVDRLLLPNVDVASISAMRALHNVCSNTLMAMGLHPTELGENPQEQLDIILHELQSGDYVAVGEVGMDLYWDTSTTDMQMQIFDRQLAEAEKLGLPVVIHCREALGQTLEVLSGHPAAHVVFHSFGGSREDVDRIRRINDAWFGINGIVTFKNSKLREVLPHIGLGRMLTETDSPYLTPAPFRGKRNESAMIPLIVSTMAQAIGISEAEMEASTVAAAEEFIPQFAAIR